ncbi:MAG TPA: hypothetical protein VL443_03690, partial [Cyclobacteriaceae bacterium]|nr:hypothetical protein [Cyclobacteriaceae bacterium]
MKLLLYIWFISMTVVVKAQHAALPKPLNLTADEDHQRMMDQLGVKVLRPGPNGDEKAPDHANYDESLANPFPELPDVLKLKNGTKVTTADMWWKLRRPEIAEDMEREVYGRLPKNIPKVTWTTGVIEREFVGFIPVIAKELKGHVDNSEYPLINVDISMMLVVPANAKGPVPVLMMFGRAGLPNPVQPNADDMKILNDAMRKLLSQDTAVKKILDKYPAYSVLPRLTPTFGGEPTREQQLIQAGWGYVSIDPASIQADNGAGLTRGIIGLVNKGQLRKPDDWGALRAWAWGAARGLDYLETESSVDAKHVGIEGVSRYGKAALVTLAFEPR